MPPRSFIPFPCMPGGSRIHSHAWVVRHGEIRKQTEVLRMRCRNHLAASSAPLHRCTQSRSSRTRSSSHLFNHSILRDCTTWFRGPKRCISRRMNPSRLVVLGVPGAPNAIAHPLDGMSQCAVDLPKEPTASRTFISSCHGSTILSSWSPEALMPMGGRIAVCCFLLSPHCLTPSLNTTQTS